MSVTALEVGRRAAESLMLDAGSAKRPTGTAYDPAEQTQVDTFAVLDAGPCKIQASSLQARTEEVGGRTATSIRLELHRPIDSTPLTVGDIWTVTEVDASSTAVLGAEYRVLAPFVKSFATARRYEIEELVS